MVMKIIQLFARTNNVAVRADGTTGWIPPAGDLATLPVEVKRYSPRTWAVYFGGQLLCVTEYRKGSRAVEALVEQLQEALRRERSAEESAEPTTEHSAYSAVYDDAAEPREQTELTEPDGATG